jgi:hypothetical protein
MDEAEAVDTEAPRDNPTRLMWNLVAEKEPDKRQTGTELARRFGTTQPHVSKLLLIASRVDPKVLTEWSRSYEGEFQVTLGDMRDLGANTPLYEQRAEYARLVDKAKLAKRHQREKHQVARRRR